MGAKRYFWVVRICLLLLALVLGVAPVMAVTAVEIGKDQDRIDINGLGTVVSGVGDRLQIETAAGTDGLTDRMSVAATVSASNPNWFVFALRNTSDTRAERWLTADRYNATGSGILGPRLDARQIENVTPSIGFLPENLALDDTDAYRLTLEPGQTVTFAVELSPRAAPRLGVWRALDYEKKARNKQLFYGVMLGITGLLALFLSAVFAANHKVIFPAAALFTWCVLAYLCVDFGFWHKLFAVRPEDNAQYRAATEAGVAASLLIFTYTFLRLGSIHGFARALLRLWIFAQLLLVAGAFLDPRLADTFARLSMGGIFALTSVFVVFLALRGQDRALSLVPAWLLLGVWIAGMAFVFAARLQTDSAVTALTSGLVLIVLLIGFTVTQYAFRTVEPVHAFGAGDQGARLLALENSGAAIWEWNARRDEINVGPGMEVALGLAAGDLHASAQVFLDRMHPVDRDRLRQALDHLKDAGSGDLHLEFRMRHVDNDYRWFLLEAATDPGADRRRARCIGLVRETTDSHSAQDRSAHDTVHDAVTGLPNRALFLDRLGVALIRARREPLMQPAVIVIDVDRFQAMATSTQHFEADGLLITLSRRLAHLIGPGETLARIGSDQFGILILAQRPLKEIQMLAESMRIAVRSLIKVGGIEITPTAAIGFAVYDRNTNTTATGVLDDAEIAMHRARRQGRDAVLGFTPDLRTDRRERAVLEADLRQAIERRQLTLLYQPIFAMRNQQIMGYEALVRWEHPRLGKLDPAEFVPLAEESDLIVKLGSAVITMAVADLQRFHAVYDRPEAPLSVSVNVSRRQLLGSGLVNQIRGIIAGAKLPKGCLRLEVTETLVMENPEHAATVLGELAAAGAGLSLDDFGTGYSSLTYLNVFPFDTIKIDRALVHGSGDAGTVSAILRSVVTLAHELGKKVVAEGVETEQDAGALRALGCEYAQGFFYDRPQTAKDVLQALKELRKAERRLKSGRLLRFKERKVSLPTTPAVPAPAAAATGGGVSPVLRRTGRPPAPARVLPAARLVPIPARAGFAPSAVPGLPAEHTQRARFAAVAQGRPLPAQPSSAVQAANNSLAALGAQMARPTKPPGYPPQRVAAAAPAVVAPLPRPAPDGMLKALAHSFSTLGPEVGVAPLPPMAPPPAPAAIRPAPPPLPPAAPSKPIDLSMLPPGVAASLARLAGQRPVTPPIDPLPPREPSRPDADVPPQRQGGASSS